MFSRKCVVGDCAPTSGGRRMRRDRAQNMDGSIRRLPSIIVARHFRHNVLVAFYFVAFDECRARPDLGLTLRVAEVLLRCSTLGPLVSSGNFFKLADLIWVGSVRKIPTAKKNFRRDLRRGISFSRGNSFSIPDDIWAKRDGGVQRQPQT